MGESRNIDGLDVLRGVAICGVILAHFFGAYIPKMVEQVSAHGGVILFFFLSGFLIDRTLAHDSNVIRYGVRRFSRILPMYWAAVLLIAVSTSKWSISDVADNMLLMASFTNQMSGVFWTLYVECLFYLLAPLAILPSRYILLAAPFVVISRFAIEPAISPMWFFLAYCFLGAQISAAWRGAIHPAAATASIAAVALASIFLLPGGGLWLGATSLSCAALLYLGLHFNPKSRVLGFVGRVSYSWYLLHSIFGYTIGWKAVSYLHLPAPIGLFIGALSMLALSAITHRFIELPGISIGKLILRRRAIAPA